MNRFEEAVEFHNVIRTLKLRFHNHPALPILVQMMENERDNALGLGLQEYGIFKEQKFSSESGTISGVPS